LNHQHKKDEAAIARHAVYLNVRGKPHWTVRLLLTTLTILAFGQVWSQTPDDYVTTIEKLRSKGKLTIKSFTDKTFVGSVTRYYDNDAIVLINSLADAEAAGTETLYFINDGVLQKVFKMAATFDSSDEWNEYYSKHKSINKCYSCHGKPDCIVTEITLGDKPEIVVTENKKKTELTQDEKEKMLADVRKISEELKALLNEIE
jgi:hypothetical protein